MDALPGWPVAMAPPQGGAQQQGSFLFSLIPFILIFVIMYVLLIAPARKRQKKHNEMLSAIRNGDKVITTGGIYGTVVGVEEDRLQLRIADQVKIEITKNAIATVQGRD